MSLPLRLNWDRAQDLWSSDINPVLNLPPNQGLLLKNIPLINGVTVINHKLGRVMQGWSIIDQDAQASIYRSAALNNLTLTLTSNAACNVSLWVF